MYVFLKANFQKEFATYDIYNSAHTLWWRSRNNKFFPYLELKLLWRFPVLWIWFAPLIWNIVEKSYRYFSVKIKYAGYGRGCCFRLRWKHRAAQKCNRVSTINYLSVCPVVVPCSMVFLWPWVLRSIPK